MKLKRIAICMALALAQNVYAEGNETMPEVEVKANRLEPLPTPSKSGLDSKGLEQKRVYTSDTARMLEDQPGVSLYGAGGVSSLPVIHGMADDRIRTKVDGMDLVASCPNHMNSPLSYVDPSNVGELKVFAGITPVSIGGDSIGGTIVANTRAPEFAADGQGSLKKGEVGARYGSNGKQRGLHANATLASESLSVTYSGAMTKSDNYKAAANFKNYEATGRTGHNLALNEVGSTAYDARNHTLAVAVKGGNHLVEAKLGYQDIPYELYPNQRMDMLDNNQKRINLRYVGTRDWGTLEARAYREIVNHYMDFGADKKLSYGLVTPCTGTSCEAIGMPMYTKGVTSGLGLKGAINLSDKDLVRVGWEYQTYRLDDWWPPSPDCGVGNCTGGMAPLTFWNINGGKRIRNGAYAEWEAQQNAQWLTQMGVRYERVTSNAGTVAGYNTTMYTTSSVGTVNAFNALDKKRSDNNIDLTALARYTPTETNTVEFGLAQKTRSPNLYERYDWSTNPMALEMNNFVGDGNGYLGNPNLKPEVARTLSATGNWHSAERDAEFILTPYYTHVTDYIDAKRRANTMMTPNNSTTTNRFVMLDFVNQSAKLYGLDVSGRMPLGSTVAGDLGLRGTLNYTRGKNQTTGDNLYNIMPLNAKVVLTQKIAGWDNALELIGVEKKSNTSAVRNEAKTPGYGLLNLRTAYHWNSVRFDLGVENLFNKMYYLPLGGAYTGQGATMSLNRETGVISTGGGTVSYWGTAVPGIGRSLYAGATLKF
jgi:iron complex outermembrane receptor protein